MKKNFVLPEHLSGLLVMHSDLSRKIESGDFVSGESQCLKKQKLAVRTAISNLSFLNDQGPPVTVVTLHPLSEDTLQLLKQRLEETLRLAKAQLLAPGAAKLVPWERLLQLVVERLSTEQEKSLVDA